MAQYKKSIYGPKVHALKKCGEIRQGPHCLVYIREHPDFGDTNLVFTLDEGVNIFSGYVYGSARKVRCRYRACPRRIVITSLKNNHTLAEITLHRTGTCSLDTQSSFFKRSLVSFVKRFLVHTMVTRTHIL